MEASYITSAARTAWCYSSVEAHDHLVTKSGFSIANKQSGSYYGVDNSNRRRRFANVPQSHCAHWCNYTSLPLSHLPALSQHECLLSVVTIALPTLPAYPGYSATIAKLHRGQTRFEGFKTSGPKVFI
ncbi:guanylate cyclase [Plakobranchus ocellatus]|uniref:Guanylate cyclase n=1 Tax=Plakobranchus ocellatus TaxID=259542 RepID=A0AAV4BSI3_9GAST|nr:guanylate cyclase [Plakobranchus ocellatus]